MGLKKPQKSLNTWTRQEWRTKSGKPSVQGPDATGEVYLPEKAIAALESSREGRKTLAKADAKKADDTAKGEQVSRTGIHKGKKRSGTA